MKWARSMPSWISPVPPRPPMRSTWTQWYCSPVNVGSGFVNCAHGRFPVPAPATAELLKNFPVYSAHVQVELVTPTGAALLRALDCRFESTPVMRTQAIGYGAGTRNPERFPNVLRVSIGEIAKGLPWGGEKVTVLECAVDDLSPQVLAHTAQLALERGALDVMSAPVTMKKGRLGTLLTVLCKPGDRDHLQQLLFRETSTLGIRVREEDRVILDREITSGTNGVWPDPDQDRFLARRRVECGARV